MNIFLDSDFNLVSRINLLKNKSPKIGPMSVRFGLSRSCNFNCATCWNYSLLLKKSKPEEWKKVRIDKNLVFNTLDEISKMGCKTVLFSGAGEPFTHPNMMDFVKRAKKNGLIVRIQTNLSLLDDPIKLTDYMKDKRDIVCVNLMAANAETYIKIHSNQDKRIFYDILDKIKILKKGKVKVRFVYIVNKLNYREIPEALKLNKELGTTLHLENMDFAPGEGVDSLSLNGATKQRIIHKLIQLKKNRKYYLESNIGNYINQLRYSGLGIKKLRNCSIGFLYSIINEEGNVFYCYNKSKNFLMGNIKEQSLKDIWHSDKYQRFRNRLLKGNFLKECKECIERRGVNFKIRHLIDLRFTKHIFNKVS